GVVVGVRVATLMTPTATGSSPMPTDTSQLPTGATLLSTSLTAGRFVASTLSIARSNASWMPVIFASSVTPFFILQHTLPVSRLYFVRTQPSGPTMVPSAASLSSQSTRTVALDA